MHKMSVLIKYVVCKYFLSVCSLSFNSLNSIEVPQKKNLKIELYDPAIPLLDIYPKETKTGYPRDTCTPVFIVTLFTIAKIILMGCIGIQWIILSIEIHWMNGERRCMCVLKYIY